MLRSKYMTRSVVKRKGADSAAGIFQEGKTSETRQPEGRKSRKNHGDVDAFVKNVGTERRNDSSSEGGVLPFQSRQRGKTVRGRKGTEKCAFRIPKTTFMDLGPDELEQVTRFLDTRSAVQLLATCKTVYQKLSNCSGFWNLLCQNENFNDYTALKQDDDDDDDDDDEEEESTEASEEDVKDEPKTKRRKLKSCWRLKSKNESTKPQPHATRTRLSWSGEPLHDVKIPKTATFWRKVFLRGLQMRRNVCQGRFEMWRLFLTEADHLPVKKLMHNTTHRELRSSHRNSRFNQRERRVRIHRFWTEDYMVAVQHRPLESFNDIFVWKWNECQDPTFLYTFDMYPMYPNGLFPTAFFLWKHYLVLMPDTGYIRDHKDLTSMIRVHDLSDDMKLAGCYDFPEDSCFRRRVRPGYLNPSNEAAHLHKLGDKAVALCRTPRFTLFVFSLPDCQLLCHVKLSFSVERPLEDDDLDQRFLMRKNTMFFMFHHPQFFYEEDEVDLEEQRPDNQEVKKYGRLLMVDFDKFAAAAAKLKHSQTNSLIEVSLNEKFDLSDDYIEKISVISKDRLACILMTGKVVLRDIVVTSKTTCSTTDRLTIPCPERLYIPPDHVHDLSGDADTDGPTMCISRDGEVILVMQHFESGRKIYAYDAKVQNGGRMLYTIDLDYRPEFRLNPKPGYVSVDMDGNFVCAADLEKIVVWNAKTGRFIRTIPIPGHYNVREDPMEMLDRFCWKGHTDFAFAEDGIVIVHSQRDFPVAADVILFW